MNDHKKIDVNVEKTNHRHDYHPAHLTKWEMEITDKIAAFAGDIRFIYYHLAIFFTWILVNSLLKNPFDKFPFILLTLLVSFEAIFLSTFVLINQNKDARRSERRSQMDLDVDRRTRVELAELRQHVLDIKTMLSAKDNNK